MDEDHEPGTHPEEVTLLDYVVGDLAPDSSDAIRRHVETCADCRDRIVDLAMEMDAIDQLPTVAIPHDVLRTAFPDGFSSAPRRRWARALPIALLLVVATGIVILFRIGGVGAGDALVQTQRQVIVHTASAQPEQVVATMLEGIPYTLTVDRDDDRHLVVLVSDADLAAAYGRLDGTSADSGRSYIVDLGGTGVLPGADQQP